MKVSINMNTGQTLTLKSELNSMQNVISNNKNSECLVCFDICF